MDKDADEVDQRRALRDELEEAMKAIVRLRDRNRRLGAGLIASAGILAMMGIAITGEIYSRSSPTCMPATVIGDAQTEEVKVAPGTVEIYEPHSDLFPLTVSIENHSRCFSIAWNREIHRDPECGYTINYKELRKAICH